ncbi:hypothetical protein [Paludibacter sp.]|uniref:hypothetical protein n=1 Tax=Paludibacter sp. TaxID=1898105 RepID=UPI001352527A|nr:hypothetical protein [Paludibacter sp.]MTK52397.1 hypothetical protein [Paludibacter sp.]
MTIEIVSYYHGLSDALRLNLTSNIINSSKSDLLLFSGHTIGFVNDIEVLKDLITNKTIEVVFELENINTDKIRNCLYRITKGQLINLYTNQILTQSSDIEGNYQLADRLLHEFETNRTFSINGISVLIIQCGEINILKNIQSEDNRVEFRLSDDKSLLERFNDILSKTKIILNPIHTPMGNQGKMLKRREFLSQNKRYYFSSCNTKENSHNIDIKSLQYAFFNSTLLTNVDIQRTEYSISRIYEI